MDAKRLSEGTMASACVHWFIGFHCSVLGMAGALGKPLKCGPPFK